MERNFEKSCIVLSGPHSYVIGVIHCLESSCQIQQHYFLMRTIHRWPLNLHGLCLSLLVRICRLSRLMSSYYTNWALRLLIAASRIATSISKGLVIGHNVVDSFIDVRLVNTLHCPCRWGHWLRHALQIYLLLLLRSLSTNQGTGAIRLIAIGSCSQVIVC